MENKVCLDGAIFEEFKSDFDTVLKDTLTKMLKNGIPEGSVTGKIKITLETRTNDFGVPYLAPIFEHKVSGALAPIFEHKVSGAATQKLDLTGTTDDEFCLETDAESVDFILNEPESAQTRMDDFAAGKR